MKLPVIALRDLVVLPKMLVQFDVNRPESIRAAEMSMALRQDIFMTCQTSMSEKLPETLDEVEAYGTIGMVKQLMKLPGGVIRVLAEGRERGLITSLELEGGHLAGKIEQVPFYNDLTDPVLAEAMMRSLNEAAVSYGHVNPAFSQAQEKQIAVIGNLPELIAQILIRLPLKTSVRQEYLNMSSEYQRADALLELLEREASIGTIQRDIQEKVKERIDKNQKDYVLHEQMREIKKELGEDEQSDAEQFRAQLAELDAPDEVREKIEKEIKRFEMIPSGSQEGTVSRTYIETLLDLPWNKRSEDSNDIKRAEEILEEDHYGMEKIKERILEFLSVRTFTGEAGGQVICLVGPPGTGKTSIARSVARALEKKYVRISLGGVHDEAEIRGHRRTYIGAMPGRIVAALRQAGVSNPLMLLDEVDKVSSDYKGDVSSALLEVLDGEQNCRFSDHYVEIPVDLSHVLFIATANSLDTVPRPLLDRMEVIEVPGYTENEKFHIAHDHLVRKQLEKNGLDAERVSFTDEALRKVIHSYTREAGVRTLERTIGSLIRKAAREILGGSESVKIDEEKVAEYLGKELVRFDAASRDNQIGIVRGLAWTAVGGDTLEIEVNVMPGEGKIQLTGKLGDVMQESAQAGLTYIRSVAGDYGIEGDFFKTHDIHLHIPEGAVPKDGPSAGITMATAMLSAASGREVLGDLAMTGEITLRGRVLPVGGLKEKLLAAKMADIHTVLVPDENRRDIEELSGEITDGMSIHFVKTMNEVVEMALV